MLTNHDIISIRNDVYNLVLDRLQAHMLSKHAVTVARETDRAFEDTVRKLTGIENK